MDRKILHIDLNNFYASVECLYNPALKALPVAVAGNPENRHGIILAKNMPAKLLGVKTGKAIWQAKQKVPNLICVPPHFDKYLRFSRSARTIYSRYTEQIEAFGIDECWLDITGSEKLFGPHIAENISAAIKSELGLTVSIGVSWNKIFAKFGSDYKKPDSITKITRENYQNIIWNKPVSDLLYVGRSTGKKLNSRAIYTIRDLALRDPKSLTLLLGKWGQVLSDFARGLDTSPVRRADERNCIKSIGNGTTTPRDISTPAEAKLVFTVLAESIAARLREQYLKAGGVAIYLRDNALTSFSRQKHLEQYSFCSEDFLKAAMELLYNNYPFTRPLRSISLQAIDLVTADTYIQLSLFEKDDTTKKENLEHTIDTLRRRFGHAAICRASTMLDNALTNFSPKEDHVIHPVSYFR